MPVAASFRSVDAELEGAALKNFMLPRSTKLICPFAVSHAHNMLMSTCMIGTIDRRDALLHVHTAVMASINFTLPEDGQYA